MDFSTGLSCNKITGKITLYPMTILIDQIIRSRRKTIALIIKQDGSLLVRAPLRATESQIHALVEDKAAWIRSKQTLVKQNAAQTAPKKYGAGENFWYLGKQYPLQIVEKGNTTLAFNGHFELNKGALPKAPEIFKSWYRQQAYAVLGERVALYAANFGFTYKQVKITSAQTRWGSCSIQGTLNFTWRLVMAPLPMIDYVVVHELAHLRVRNHGKKFWAEVKAILPDYQEKRDWFNKNGQALNL